jgi:hypothetical protein
MLPATSTTVRCAATGARAATRDPNEAKSTPLEKLHDLVETEGMSSKTVPRSFVESQRELYERWMEAERGILALEPLPLPNKPRMKASR